MGTQPVLKGEAGYKKYQGDALWLPNTTRPVWLDGSLPGDRGFDPLGLSKPVEYLQFELDQLDQNQAQNIAGNVVGSFKPTVDEIKHGRLAMVASFGLCVQALAVGEGALGSLAKFA